MLKVTPGGEAPKKKGLVTMTRVAKNKSDSKTKKPEVMEQIQDAEEDKDLMNVSYTICASLHGGND